MKIKINNAPDYAHKYRYWVVRKVDKEFWFFGSWNDLNTARAICKTVGNGRLYVPGMKKCLNSKDSI